MQARPYQEIALDSICTAYDQGWHQQILAMATGTGKTFIFSNLPEKLASRLPGQTLVLSHTEELVDQSVATMRAINPSLKVDKEMAEYKADPSTADVVVASVATLGRLNTSRLAKFDVEKWTKIIVDEAHHTPAESYMRILDAFHVLEDGTKKLLLGCTATPSRSDNKALGAIYKKLVYTYGIRQAIEDGFLVNVRGYRVITQTDISGVHLVAGDFNTGELVEAIDNPDRNKRVVEAWLKWGEGRRTVVYAASIEHAKHLSDAFNEAGVPTAAIWGSDDDRVKKLHCHENGDLRVLVNCSLLNEGWDSPSVSCIVHGAPTASSVRFTQRCGRATRLFEAKKDCIILDLVDLVGHHSLCTLPSLIGLPETLDLQGRGLVEAAHLIEAEQEKYPDIDFTKLKAVEGLQQFIETVNLFEVRFEKEVEDNSTFKWARAIDGGYVMNIPVLPTDTTGTKPGRVKIYQDLLDKWHVSGIIKLREFHGIRDSIEEVFAVADQQIRERAPESVSIVDRTAAWNYKPASSAQRKMLARLYKGQMFPEDLTKGQASAWIDKRLSKFKK